MSSGTTPILDESQIISISDGGQLNCKKAATALPASPLAPVAATSSSYAPNTQSPATNTGSNNGSSQQRQRPLYQGSIVSILVALGAWSYLYSWNNRHF
jgi:hypothetical protein